jgi:DNA-binding winged helix-turn-helix (wHTH) protein
VGPWLPRGLRHSIIPHVQQRFDDITIDAETRQLWRGGREVHLSPKAFDLLAVLVARRPAAVSKIAIRELLWPDTFVSETNLPALVAEIRAALGDDARQPRFVRTLHRIGYAFHGQPSVEAVGTAQPSAWLVGGSTRIPLFAGENILGREGAGVIALDCEMVSRRHARVMIDEGRAWIEDLGSKNGTYVNEHRIAARVTLSDGARVCVGSLMFTFRAASPAGETSTASTPQKTPRPPGSGR